MTYDQAILILGIYREMHAQIYQNTCSRMFYSSFIHNSFNSIKNFKAETA